MNFAPTCPVADIASEYVTAFLQLYEPVQYLDRVYRCFLKMGPPRCQPAPKRPEWVDIRALLIVCWQQGVVRPTRYRFWIYLVNILRKNPRV